MSNEYDEIEQALMKAKQANEKVEQLKRTYVETYEQVHKDWMKSVAQADAWESANKRYCWNKDAVTRLAALLYALLTQENVDKEKYYVTPLFEELQKAAKKCPNPPQRPRTEYSDIPTPSGKTEKDIREKTFRAIALKRMGLTEKQAQGMGF